MYGTLLGAIVAASGAGLYMIRKKGTKAPGAPMGCPMSRGRLRGAGGLGDFGKLESTIVMEKLMAKEIAKGKGKSCPDPKFLHAYAVRALQKRLAKGDFGPKKLSVKDANLITGGLSKTSKTGFSYGLPNWACKQGAKLALTPGSTCSKCYASRGKYGTCNVRWVQARRLAALQTHPRWLEAMDFLLTKKEGRGMDHFRWHDAGDLQDQRHLDAIIFLAKRHPKMIFWLPTKEYGLAARARGKLPENITMRVSAQMVDGVPLTGYPTSTVHSDKSVAEVFANPIETCTIHGPLSVKAQKACAALRPILARNPNARARICPIAGERLRKHGTTNEETQNMQPEGRNLPEIKSCRAMNCDACWQRNIPWVSYKAH